MSKYIVKLTMEEAQKLGIVRCGNCGYPPNNHFTLKPVKQTAKMIREGIKAPSACAFASCPGYQPKFTMGKVIPITVHL